MKEWTTCPVCGHKLFRNIEVASLGKSIIEKKCHSCRSIVSVVFKDGDTETAVLVNGKENR